MAAIVIEQLLSDERVQEGLARLPAKLGTLRNRSAIMEECRELKGLLRKHGGGIFGIGRTIPSRQVEICQHRLLLIERILRALALGYEPYHPSSNWYVGWFGNRELFTWAPRFLFNAPVPQKTAERYQTAKRTGIFQAFLVASPDRKLFTTSAGIFCEPALIGYVQGKFPIEFSTGGAGEQQPGLSVENGVGFLIDMWDLKKDRRVAGMDF